MGADSESLVMPIAENGLLLHVGVFKTGTTALQDALRHSSEVLAPADVLYRGPHSWRFQPLRELAATQNPSWTSLVGDVVAHQGRAMVSSENLCGCDDAEARSVVDQLGAGRSTRVLLTVRSLAALLPSTWQQFLKRGMSTPYADWLAEVLADAPAGRGAFWRRNDFVTQVRRWGDLVGTANVTVVVSDKAEPNRLLRVTERLLALAEDSLHFREDSRKNESLSFPAAELLRLVNEATHETLTRDYYRNLVRLGMFPATSRADSASDPRIPVPQPVAEEMTRLGSEQAEQLAGSGAQIVGDLSLLASKPSLVAPDAAPPVSIALSSAAAAVSGALLATERLGNPAPDSQRVDSQWRRIKRRLSRPR
ncbi:MAG: hypothetical protein K0U60_00045 [Actinomycetia bacterium]|nr:hypothetical protein [Actinomycetes bacterium]